MVFEDIEGFLRDLKDLQGFLRVLTLFLYGRINFNPPDKKFTTEGSYANFVEKYMHVNSYQYTRIPLH